jgi:tetratricopeptide (TPR) repeat protein
MAQFPDGRSFVLAALDAVSRAGMAPVDMRYFPARDSKPADYCRQRVRDCEIYVAVIGFRYGSVVPGESMSYTELEFDEAGSAGLPRLVFLLDSAAGLPAVLADQDRGAVQGFRQRLRDAGLIVRGFASDVGLELEVFHALTEVAAGRPAAPGTASSVLAVRYSLPPDTAAFTGRDGELHRISAAIADAAGTGRVVAIHAIGGMPGIGKTALAVHVAHLLRDRFGDRQLFINLHGHTPGQDPVAPAAALAGLLTAVGVDARNLPGDLDGRAGMWRDRMARQRALLVLDNAASSDQVTPLLPGGDDCLVLVTSRRQLGDLPGPVVPVLLDALPPEQAQEMFLALAPRAATQPEVVRELAGLAGYLPLAISLLARVYARHPTWTLADLIAETKASLLTLAAEKDSVTAAFDVSYRYLPPGQQQFFCLLGLHLGTTTDAYAAAALAGIPLPEATGYLDALHGEGLLTEAGYHRYGMHDLIRRYSRDLATDPAASPDRAMERLLDFYQHTAATAQAILARQPRTMPAPSALTAPPEAVPDLPDNTRALAWARAERGNLLASLDHVTRTGQHAQVVTLTAAIAALLRLDGPWTDAITRHATALQAARQLGDQRGQANALNELGAARNLTGDYTGAAQGLEEALEIYRDLGDLLGQANVLSNLGAARRMTDDYPGAAQALEEALDIYRDLGDRLGQAGALNELGAARRMTDDYPGVARTLEEALGIYRDLGDRQGQATATRYLGVVRLQTGDYPGAARAQEEALSISSDLGDRQGQANALTYLGVVRQLTGDYPGSVEALEEALSVYRDLGNRLGQANALTYLGATRSQTGDCLAATWALAEALSISSDLGHRLGRADAQRCLGAVRCQTGDYPGSAGVLEEALSIYRGLGDPGGEVEVLNDTGTLHRIRGDLEPAAACHRQAADLARKIGSPRAEANALAGLGRCALAAGHVADAETGLRQALEILERIGGAEAVGVATELDTLTEVLPTPPRDP